MWGDFLFLVKIYVKSSNWKFRQKCVSSVDKCTFSAIKNKNKSTTVVINRSRRYHTHCCSRHHLRSHLHRRRLLQAVDGNILLKRKKSFNKWQIPSLFDTLRCRKKFQWKIFWKCATEWIFNIKNTIKADLNLYKSLQKKFQCHVERFYAACKNLFSFHLILLLSFSSLQFTNILFVFKNYIVMLFL